MQCVLLVFMKVLNHRKSYSYRNRSPFANDHHTSTLTLCVPAGRRRTLWILRFSVTLSGDNFALRGSSKANFGSQIVSETRSIDCAHFLLFLECSMSRLSTIDFITIPSLMNNSNNTKYSKLNLRFARLAFGRLVEDEFHPMLQNIYFDDALIHAAKRWE